MIVWGGRDGVVRQNTGGRYNPSIDSWTATSTTGAPARRDTHTAIWTGSEMIIWGGENNNGSNLNTGGRYNPGTDSWTATSTTFAPTPRAVTAAVWTGSEMIVWGGFERRLVQHWREILPGRTGPGNPLQSVPATLAPITRCQQHLRTLPRTTPISLTTLSCQEAKRGMCSRSTLKERTSMARDLPIVSTSSSIATAEVFPEHGSIARSIDHSRKVAAPLRVNLPTPAVLTAGRIGSRFRPT